METKKSYLLILFVLCILAPQSVHGASLYLSPSSGSYTLGNTITLSVFAESVSEAFNAVSGTVAIPSGVDVVSVSSTGSIINFWVQEPSYISGAVRFEGVVLNPGYKGSGGKIATITLRAKTQGSHTLSYTSASILANDGKGTNLLSGTRGATLSVSSSPNVETIETPKVTETPEIEETDGEEDTEGPVVSLFRERPRASSSDPRILLEIVARDTSGIASYVLSIDGGAYVPIHENEAGFYELMLSPGIHTLSLKVADTLGIETRKTLTVSVTPLATLTITDYEEKSSYGAPHMVRGHGAVDSDRVTLTLTPLSLRAPLPFISGRIIDTLPRTIAGTVTEEASWSVFLKEIPPGTYRVIVTGYDSRGAASYPSAPVEIIITPSWYVLLAEIVLSPIVLVCVSVGVIRVSFLRLNRLRTRVSTAVEQTERSLHHSFKTMQQNIAVERGRIKNKRDPSSKEEKELLEVLEENIETAEQRVLEKLDAVAEEEPKERT